MRNQFELGRRLSNLRLTPNPFRRILPYTSRNHEQRHAAESVITSMAGFAGRDRPPTAGRPKGDSSGL